MAASFRRLATAGRYGAVTAARQSQRTSSALRATTCCHPSNRLIALVQIRKSMARKKIAMPAAIIA